MRTLSEDDEEHGRAGVSSPRFAGISNERAQTLATLRQRTPSPEVFDAPMERWRVREPPSVSLAPETASVRACHHARRLGLPGRLPRCCTQHARTDAWRCQAKRTSEEVQRDLARRSLTTIWPVVAERAGQATPIETAYGGDFLVEARVRALWLLGLLVLQSLSSFILEANQGLIREHLVITLFLTMLVGAGGNSGAQSAVHVIRGLATGQYPATLESFRTALQQQLKVGVLLGTALAIGGYARVVATEGVPLDATAIAASLFVIVNVSVLAGTTLPFALAWRGVDPAHAGTTVQVVMDVLGVGITCAVCRLVLTGNAGVLSAAASADMMMP